MQSAGDTNNLLVSSVFHCVGEDVCCLTAKYAWVPVSVCCFMRTYSPLWEWWADWFCSPRSCHSLLGHSTVLHLVPQWTGWPTCCPKWWHWWERIKKRKQNIRCRFKSVTLATDEPTDWHESSWFFSIKKHLHSALVLKISSTPIHPTHVETHTHTRTHPHPCTQTHSDH